jgi:hypothetical protein
MLRLSHRSVAMALALVVPAACSGASASMKGKANAASRDLVAARGTVIELTSRDVLTSRRNRPGDTVVATATSAALDAARDTVVPVGAEFLGTVQEIAPAPNPRATGRLRLAFTAVRIGGVVHPIGVRVTELGTELKGRGVTGGTVAKVGAGAAIGGLVGRLVGGNTTGALVGAAAGGAAGGVYAHETRSLDVVLPRGSRIRVALTGPFAAGVATAR